MDYRIVHHTFAFWDPPLNLRYCGRDYVPTGLRDRLPTDGRLIPVYHVQPGDWQVYKHTFDPADTTTGCGRNGPVGELELVRNQHEVDEYALSGGP